MSKVDPLDCVMLNAADAAYSILPHQGWTAPPPGDNTYRRFYDSVPWTPESPPVAVVGGSEQTDACLIGTVNLPDDGGKAAVVAYRGTLPFADKDVLPAQIYDWVVNDLLTIAPIEMPELGENVKVHHGWWDSVGAIWGKVLERLEELYAIDSEMPLFFTGHSKGGPMASLSAARLWLDQKAGRTRVPLPTVITFASPHPGNKAFRHFYEGVIKTHRRWEYAYDIVPVMPPTPTGAAVLGAWILENKKLNDVEKGLLEAFLAVLATWDYSPVGELWYINSKGEHAILTMDEIEAWRLNHEILPHIEDLGTKAIGSAHCPICRETDTKNPCDGGYQSGACGSSVCG